MVKVKKTCTLIPVTTGSCRENPMSFKLPLRPLPAPVSNSFLFALTQAFARAISVMLLNPLGLGLWNSTVTVRGTRGEVHRKVASVAQQLNLSVRLMQGQRLGVGSVGGWLAHGLGT